MATKGKLNSKIEDPVRKSVRQHRNYGPVRFGIQGRKSTRMYYLNADIGKTRLFAVRVYAKNGKVTCIELTETKNATKWVKGKSGFWELLPKTLWARKYGEIHKTP